MSKAALLKLQMALNGALAKAAAYTDSDLNAAGLQAKREQLALAARQDAAPALEQLRAQVTSNAQALTEQAAAALPQFGADPAAIARSQHKWDQVRMRLDAGMPMRTILERADVETALAIREWGPAWTEAQTYREPTSAEAFAGTAVPDHAPLMRSVDRRLAELTGPNAVAALTAAHEAAAEAAGVEVQGKYLADVIAGTHTGSTAMGAAFDAHYAEQGARAGLGVPDAPADDAPAAEGVTA